MNIKELFIDPLIDYIITEEHVMEMARIKPADSGLQYIMFASTKEYVHGRHWARIKVSNIPNTFSSNDNFVVSISKTPTITAGVTRYNSRELQDIYDWNTLNYDALMKYWNEQYPSDADFYRDLKRI